MNRFVVATAITLALITGACGNGQESEAGEGAVDLSEDAAAATETVKTTEASTTTTSVAETTTTEAPPAFQFLDRGDFTVGVSTFTVDEGSERPLTVEVWYPVGDGTTGEPRQYTLLPGVYYESPSAITAETTAIPDSQFPLVVYSHGSGGQRWIHSDYTEFMASHGYIVVAPDHTGNTLFERFAGTDIDPGLIAFQRPTDVTAVLDAALATDPSEPLGAALANALTDDVIVTGHSFGGFTSYATVSGVTTTAGTYPADERVDAIITLAPAAGPQLLTDELLSQVDVPHLVIVGDSDDTTPIDPNVERPWALTTGSPNYRVELAAAEHESFTDLCDYGAFLPELEAVPEFVLTAIDGFSGTSCAETVMPLERAQEITNTFAVRFLDEVTQGAPALSDDNATYDNDLTFLTR